MKHSIVTIPLVLLFTWGTKIACQIDLSPLINQIMDMRTQLVSAVTELSKGKQELYKVYQDGKHGLKPQLLDQLEIIIKETEKNVKDIKGSLDPLKKLPPFVKKVAVKVANIVDLEPTLIWITQKPLKAIIDYLKQTHKRFKTLGEKIRPGSPESAALDQHFTNAVTSLQKAVCRVERTLAALKEDFVVSGPCQK